MVFLLFVSWEIESYIAISICEIITALVYVLVVFILTCSTCKVLWDNFDMIWCYKELNWIIEAIFLIIQYFNGVFSIFKRGTFWSYIWVCRWRNGFSTYMLVSETKICSYIEGYNCWVLHSDCGRLKKIHSKLPLRILCSHYSCVSDFCCLFHDLSKAWIQ